MPTISSPALNPQFQKIVSISLSTEHGLMVHLNIKASMTPLSIVLKGGGVWYPAACCFRPVQLKSSHHTLKEMPPPSTRDFNAYDSFQLGRPTSMRNQYRFGNRSAKYAASRVRNHWGSRVREMVKRKLKNKLEKTSCFRWRIEFLSKTGIRQIKSLKGQIKNLGKLRWKKSWFL